jgi:Raf kinase inhibitor-like YbhB/YbcL family protein
MRTKRQQQVKETQEQQRSESGQPHGGRGVDGYEDHGDAEMGTLPPSDELPDQPQSHSPRHGAQRETQKARAATMTLVTPAFTANGRIPKKYAGEGDDVSPPLSWRGVPPGTRELALICDDPDAPQPKPWVHWVAYQIPPTQTGLRENAHGNLTEGQNDFGRRGYGGPLPPQGHGLHRYHFHLYALDQHIEAEPGLTKDQLLDAMRGHVLAEGELVGSYERA